MPRSERGHCGGNRLSTLDTYRHARVPPRATRQVRRQRVSLAKVYTSIPKTGTTFRRDYLNAVGAADQLTRPWRESKQPLFQPL